MNLDDFKYNRANITAFSLVKPYTQFFKSISLNLTDYYSINGKDQERSSVLLYVCLTLLIVFFWVAVHCLKFFIFCFFSIFKTRNALLFDAIFTLSTAIKEAEKSFDLNTGSVSCYNKSTLSFGRHLSEYVERVNIEGLTGQITFSKKERRDFLLDVYQLKETGLFKCGSWSLKQRLNFTFYDEVYEDLVFSPKKNQFRVVTLVVSRSFRSTSSLFFSFFTYISKQYVYYIIIKKWIFFIRILTHTHKSIANWSK